MKAIEKSFTVELTEREVALITDAVQTCYLEFKQSYDDEKREEGMRVKDLQDKYKIMYAYRDLRNALSALINRQYMGADA